LTARPEGSFIFLKAASHSRAIAVEQATLASEGALLFGVALSLATSSTPRHVEKEK